MTTYYIDADNGDDLNDGLSVGAAWLTLDQFAENVRTAGDVATLRRGMTARYDNGSDLTPTSSGSFTDPIVIEADYDDAWGDFANSAQTYTATFGSKTLTASATITGIAAGDWIYVSTDDPRELAYEVAGVTSDTLTLYLPFKGALGSGLTLVVMPDAPVWNIVTGNFQINFNDVANWIVRGLLLAGTDGNGVVEIDGGNGGFAFYDCAITPASDDYGMYAGELAASTWLHIQKCRFFDGFASLVFDVTEGVAGNCEVRDCLFDGNETVGTFGIAVYSALTARIVDTEFTGYDTDIDLEFAGGESRLVLQNVLLPAATPINYTTTLSHAVEVYAEDYNGTPGDTRIFNILTSASNTPVMQSDAVKVRAGGAERSIKVTPSTRLSTTWEHTRLKVFELPIYMTTAEKTITVYFASDDTAEWTAGPTAAELWIELEYWGHATNSFRKITKSTGTVDFTTDTDFDQPLSLTVTPAQEGLAYLRCWYAKTKEASDANVFYVDPLPVLS